MRYPISTNNFCKRCGSDQARTDPRRVLVTYMSASLSPRAQRWYRVAVAAEFDGEIMLLQDFAASIDGSRCNHSTKRRSDAVAAAKAHAREKGFTYLAGVWQGVHGHPMKREA